MLHSIKAKDYMTASLVTLSPDTPVMEAIKLFLDNGISGAPVLDKLLNWAEAAPDEVRERLIMDPQAETQATPGRGASSSKAPEF